MANFFSKLFGKNKKEAEEKARIEAEEAARQAEEKAKIEAEEAARQAEENAKIEAEEATRQAEEKAKIEAEEAARQAKEKVRIEAEEAARQAEEKARIEAEEAARQAEEKARIEAEEAARQAEEKARIEAEEAARQAEEKAKKEAEEATRQAEEKAKIEAEEAARQAEEKAKIEAEEAARQAEEKARIEAEEAAKKEEKPVKKGFFAKIKEGLAKTKNNLTYQLNTIFNNYTKIDDEFLDELEEILITSDIGVDLTLGIIEYIKEEVRDKKITEPSEIKQVIKDYLINMLVNTNHKQFDDNKQKIMMIVGVNGVGKTTSIGKLAYRLQDDGKSVIVAAADTFRAAAVEQLTEWCHRSGVELVSSSTGADPASVIYDSIEAARARKSDVLICDTAGRLHNKVNLMNELKKMFKIIDREFGNADREVLLVVDATTGQNGLIQAKMFKETCDIDGIILTKLDGTAKGGIVFPIVKELDVPIRYIGIGEKIDDLQKFDEKMFVDAIFE